MMTDEQRAQIKQLIEQSIREIEESIPRLQERMAPVSPDSAIGRLSRTDSMMNAGTVGLALKDAQSRLARLRKRLLKIDDSDFDRCGVCMQEISMERLIAVPDRGVCPQCLTKMSKR